MPMTPFNRARSKPALRQRQKLIDDSEWKRSRNTSAVGTAATITYFAVRPEPDPVPYDGGNTGWVVGPAAIQF